MFLAKDLQAAIAHLSASKSTVLCVFDFDWTLINANSDVTIIERLAPDLAVQLDEMQMRPEFKGEWTLFMDHLMSLLTRRGALPADIANAVKDVELDPAMNAILQRMKAAGHIEVVILSDANDLFIEAILKHYGLWDAFTLIVTNPVRVERPPSIADTPSPPLASEQLRILPHSPTVAPPHRCSICPVNMCKGTVLDAILAGTNFSQVFYTGDGSNDFCPATRLARIDWTFARASFALGRKLADNAKAAPRGTTDAVDTGVNAERKQRAKLLDAAQTHPAVAADYHRKDARLVISNVALWHDHAELLALFQTHCFRDAGRG